MENLLGYVPTTMLEAVKADPIVVEALASSTPAPSALADRAVRQLSSLVRDAQHGVNDSSASDDGDSDDCHSSLRPCSQARAYKLPALADVDALELALEEQRNDSRPVVRFWNTATQAAKPVKTRGEPAESLTGRKGALAWYFFKKKQ